MWLRGGIALDRYKEYRRVGKRWVSASGSWAPSPALAANPATFLYAVARTAVRGHPPGWRGVRSALFSACAALSYLERGKHTRSSLSLHPDLQFAKDFVGTGMKGVIGAAFSLIEAQSLGYPWFGHWEDAFGPVGQDPDFIVFKSGEMVLVEAKGTEQDDPSRANWLKSQWMGQVGPHLSWTGANDGWLIATCLRQSSTSFLERLVASSPAAMHQPETPSPVNVRAVWLLRGIGRWLGWSTGVPDRVHRWGITRPIDMPVDVENRTRQSTIDPQELEALRKQVSLSEQGLLAGPTITMQLNDETALTARTFCEAHTAELLLSVAQRGSGVVLPDPQVVPRVEQLGRGIGIFWSDGTGIHVIDHSRSPEETLAAFIGE